MQSMALLPFSDRRCDPQGWARELGISREAVEIYLASEVIDLHVDSFIWHRVLGYDLRQRHGPARAGADLGAIRRSWYGHVDLPRALEAALGGAVWAITTNPARSAAGRTATALRNLTAFGELFATVAEQFEIVRSSAEYWAARAAGKHGAFIGIQGGNALDSSLEALDAIPKDLVVLVTLIHLTSSRIGATSSPLGFGRDQGLSPFGREFVRRLDELRIFVDLAHITRRGFFDAVETHDPSLPLLVSHTGVSGICPHWRNLDDEQLRAVADTGGTVGVMYHAPFLGDPSYAGRASTVLAHLAYLVETIGDDFASLGSDWDGAITTPLDMATCLELPRLVELMLQVRWRPERIQKVLGGNFLRVLDALRGEPT